MDVAPYARPHNVLEASIGLAASNSLICVDKATIGALARVPFSARWSGVKGGDHG